MLQNPKNWPDVLSKRLISAVRLQILSTSKSKAVVWMAIKTTDFGWGSLTFRLTAKTINSEEQRATFKLPLLNLNWPHKCKQATMLIGNIWHQVVNRSKPAQLHWNNAAAALDTRRWCARGILPRWHFEDCKPAMLRRCSWLNTEQMASTSTFTSHLWPTNPADSVPGWWGLWFLGRGVEAPAVWYIS